jgi:Zn finger protein HypA/HybF involved in hydrogenase expression
MSNTPLDLITLSFTETIEYSSDKALLDLRALAQAEHDRLFGLAASPLLKEMSTDRQRGMELKLLAMGALLFCLEVEFQARHARDAAHLFEREVAREVCPSCNRGHLLFTGKYQEWPHRHERWQLYDCDHCGSTFSRNVEPFGEIG